MMTYYYIRKNNSINWYLVCQITCFLGKLRAFLSQEIMELKRF